MSYGGGDPTGDSEYFDHTSGPDQLYANLAHDKEAGRRNRELLHDLNALGALSVTQLHIVNRSERFWSVVAEGIDGKEKYPATINGHPYRVRKVVDGHWLGSLGTWHWLREGYAVHQDGMGDFRPDTELDLGGMGFISKRGYVYQAAEHGIGPGSTENSVAFLDPTRTHMRKFPLKVALGNAMQQQIDRVLARETRKHDPEQSGQ